MAALTPCRPEISISLGIAENVRYQPNCPAHSPVCSSRKITSSNTTEKLSRFAKVLPTDLAISMAIVVQTKVVKPIEQ
jgi:hypothetical protein